MHIQPPQLSCGLDDFLFCRSDLSLRQDAQDIEAESTHTMLVVRLLQSSIAVPLAPKILQMCTKPNVETTTICGRADVEQFRPGDANAVHPMQLQDHILMMKLIRYEAIFHAASVTSISG